MSRGLGLRQHLMLRALVHLEEQHGAGQFYVWAVLEAAWELELRQEHEAERVARKNAEMLWKQEMAERAAQGDSEAQRNLDTQRLLDSLDRALRGNGGQGRWKRPKGTWLEDVNPSRVFALLARRGLVVRHAQAGQGSSVALTDAGRIAAAKPHLTPRLIIGPRQCRSDEVIIPTAEDQTECER